jgi:hypothetical protein
MRIATLIVLSIAVSGGGVAVGQRAPADRDGAKVTPDEVIVRGRQVGELRVEVQRAREHAYAIFNDINSDNDFDVHCRDETRYFSHSKRRVCRAQFESRISSQAATEYTATLRARCPPNAEGAIQWQACMFGDVGQTAKANAQAVEGQATSMHDRMNDEVLRLARTDLRFGQAILDFFDASQQYEAARKRRKD